MHSVRSHANTKTRKVRREYETNANQFLCSHVSFIPIGTSINIKRLPYGMARNGLMPCM